MQEIRLTGCLVKTWRNRPRGWVSLSDVWWVHVMRHFDHGNDLVAHPTQKSRWHQSCRVYPSLLDSISDSAFHQGLSKKQKQKKFNYKSLNESQKPSLDKRFVSDNGEFLAVWYVWDTQHTLTSRCFWLSDLSEALNISNCSWRFLHPIPILIGNRK